MEPLQVIFCDLHRHTDLDIGSIPLKIFPPDLIISAHCSQGIKDSGFPRVIFSDKYKGVFNLPDLHLSDGLKIPDAQIRNLHFFHLPGYY